MFKIMENLIWENGNRNYLPKLDYEIIMLFCSLYSIEVNDNMHITLENVKSFIRE